jgi:hypothetical protein
MTKETNSCRSLGRPLVNNPLHIAPTLGCFLRRIAINYLRYGYYRWVLRVIPRDRDLTQIDTKLIQIYGVTLCRTTRMRQRRRGLAVVQYVRWGHTFILLATEGSHQQFDRLRSFDTRDTPIVISAYTLGVRSSRVMVEVRHRAWQAVTNRIHRQALYDRSIVEASIATLPFYRFPGVIRQMRDLVKAVNLRRRVAGLPLVETRIESRWKSFIGKKRPMVMN